MLPCWFRTLCCCCAVQLNSERCKPAFLSIIMFWGLILTCSVGLAIICRLSRLPGFNPAPPHSPDPSPSAVSVSAPWQTFQVSSILRDSHALPHWNGWSRDDAITRSLGFLTLLAHARKAYITKWTKWTTGMQWTIGTHPDVVGRLIPVRKK